MKRNENEGKGKKRRSSGNNTLEYLKERNERLDEFKKEELEVFIHRVRLGPRPSPNRPLPRRRPLSRPGS